MNRPERTVDRLVGSWRIVQLRRGQRFSTDDMAAAWMAVRARPGALRLLDLGCGVGSVGLMALHQLPERSTLTGIEAQAESVELLRETLRLNQLEARVRVVQGDLRDPGALPEGERFELVTGTPPYIPLGRGLVSPVPQRAAARMELRGSVFDYCRAARRWLAPGGRFCFAMAAQDPRIEAAPREAGLVVLARRDLVFRWGQLPLVATLLCAREEDVDEAARWEETLVVRGPDGRWTEAYEAMRREMS